MTIEPSILDSSLKIAAGVVGLTVAIVSTYVGRLQIHKAKIEAAKAELDLHKTIKESDVYTEAAYLNRLDGRYNRCISEAFSILMEFVRSFAFVILVVLTSVVSDSDALRIIALIFSWITLYPVALRAKKVSSTLFYLGLATPRRKRAAAQLGEHLPKSD